MKNKTKMKSDLRIWLEQFVCLHAYRWKSHREISFYGYTTYKCAKCGKEKVK